MRSPCPLEIPIPPEASTEDPAMTVGRMMFDALAPPLSQDETELEDESPLALRVDFPTSVQLETRGVTSQVTTLADRIEHPQSQPEFWSRATTHKNSVAAKLRQAGRPVEAARLEQCHSTFTVCRCNDCARVRRFPNRCDLGYCPECQPRLAWERKESVTWWCREISQPKHVVLTVRNTADLQPGHVHEIKAWFSRLRRRKFASNWTGGFYSLEVTNEGKGWHLHIHALVDAQWINASQLAQEWNSVTRGAGHIVKVKDARQHNYLAEVTKYTVKGSQLAAWTPDQISTFITAFDGQRTFGVFGSLYGKRTEWREWIDSVRDAKPRCPCGSCNVTYYSEHDWLMLDLQPDQSQAHSRPPPREQTPDLNFSAPLDHFRD